MDRNQRRVVGGFPPIPDGDISIIDRRHIAGFYMLSGLRPHTISGGNHLTGVVTITDELIGQSSASNRLPGSMITGNRRR